MSQGKSKTSKISKSQHISHKLKKMKRHGNIDKKNHHLSQIKPEKIPNKNKESTNDPALLSKIYDNQINQKIAKKIKGQQKRIYKSIEQTIIDRAKKNKEVFDIL